MITLDTITVNLGESDFADAFDWSEFFTVPVVIEVEAPVPADGPIDDTPIDPPVDDETPAPSVDTSVSDDMTADDANALANADYALYLKYGATWFDYL